MDGVPANDDDREIFGYLDALRRRLIEAPSELTERRHLHAMVAEVANRTTRRSRVHVVGRIAALAFAAMLIAFNGSALATALPSMRDLASGIGRAVHVVFDGSSDQSGRDHGQPVVSLPQQVEDPVAHASAPPAVEKSPASAPARPTEPKVTTGPNDAAVQPEPDVVWTGESCGLDAVTLRFDGTGDHELIEVEGLDAPRIDGRGSWYRIGFDGGSLIVRLGDEGVSVQPRCHEARATDEQDGRRRSGGTEDGVGRGDDWSGEGRDADRDGRRWDGRDRRTDRSPGRQSDRQGGNR
jgi:hypothetical protein